MNRAADASQRVICLTFMAIKHLGCFRDAVNEGINLHNPTRRASRVSRDSYAFARLESFDKNIVSGGDQRVLRWTSREATCLCVFYEGCLGRLRGISCEMT